MLRDQNILWRGGREVVEEFVTRFYPEETVYVQYFWKQLSAAWDRAHGLRGPEIKEHLDQWRALRFAQNQRLNLITPFAIMTVMSVLQESNLDVVVPSIESFRRAICKVAAEFGAPAALTKQMEQRVAQSLHDLFQQPEVVRSEGSLRQPQEHRQTICINVSKPSTVDGREIRLGAGQLTSLLCEFGRRRRLHWAHGFVLFESWCQSPSAKPCRRFASVVGKLAMALKDAGAEAEVKAAKKGGQNSGFWQLVVPERVQIVGEIVEARTLREKSTELIESGRRSEGAEALQQSIETDPDCVASFLLVARLVRAGGGDLLTHDYLRMAWYRLRRAEINLHDAITVLAEKGEEREWRGDWGAVIAIRQELEETLERVSEAMAVVTKFVDSQEILSEDDLEFSRICSLVRRIHEDQGSPVLFQELLENKTVRDTCEAVRAKLRRIFRRNADYAEGGEMDTAIQDILWTTICSKDRRGGRPENYGGQKALKNSWIATLTIASAEEILELEYGIGKADQRILRDYKTAVKRARQNSTEEIVFESGVGMGEKWDASAIRQATAIQQRMESIGHQVDLNEYWDLIRGRRA